MKKLLLLFLVLSIVSCATKPKLDGSDDPNLWLENIEGEKALNWVKGQNEKTLAEMTSGDRFKQLEGDALNILQAKDKIPYVRFRGKYLYNFWQDKKNVRGLWRRTSLKSYMKKKPRWETVIDFDQLAKKEKENWVFKGSTCLAPKYERCLLRLSRGGKDAVVVREFDARTKKFVKNGFETKEAKTWIDWNDKDSVFIGTNYGPNSLTESGYPRQLKLWKRGADLMKTKVLYEADKKEMGIFGSTMHSSRGDVKLIGKWKTFFTYQYSVYEKGKLTKIPMPESASLNDYFMGHFIVQLKKDWDVKGKVFKQGSLVAIKKTGIYKGQLASDDVTSLYEPDSKTSILQVRTTRDKILINVLQNVRGQLLEISYGSKGFSAPTTFAFNESSHLVLAATNIKNNNFFFRVNGFLSPDAFYYNNGATGKYTKVKSLPQKFNSKDMTVKQMWATSKDGTKVPYWVVGKKEVIEKGKAPTLLYGYGGFEVSLTPSYKAVEGKLWLERGGLYVLANIRGGGEFGPKWHQAALKTNRQKAYDDFISVGEALVSTGMTTKDNLAIMGGSNGGLLVGAVMTQRPDLFKAVLCLVPLLDMVRYSQLLAGASWVGEYGDPKNEAMRDYILTYSPYHNLSDSKTYPETFFMTSTKDDRVHPGHARKMAAKMLNMGHKKIRYYENTEGGHAASSNLKQRARMKALSYEFLFKTITQ